MVPRPQASVRELVRRYLAGDPNVTALYESVDEEREEFFSLQRGDYIAVQKKDGDGHPVCVEYGDLPAGTVAEVVGEIRRRHAAGSWGDLKLAIDPCWLVHRALDGGGLESAVVVAARAFELAPDAQLVADGIRYLWGVLEGYLASLDEMGDDDSLAQRVRALLLGGAADRGRPTPIGRCQICDDRPVGIEVAIDPHTFRRWQDTRPLRLCRTCFEGEHYRSRTRGRPAPDTMLLTGGASPRPAVLVDGPLPFVRPLRRASRQSS